MGDPDVLRFTTANRIADLLDGLDPSDWPSEGGRVLDQRRAVRSR